MRVESWSGLFVSYQPMSCSQAESESVGPCGEAAGLVCQI